MIIVTASMVVKPGAGEQFEVAVRDVSAPTRNEDGCDFYECYQSLESADSYLFYEEWRDTVAVEAHTQTTHFLEFYKATPELVTESKVQIHTVAETRVV